MTENVEKYDDHGILFIENMSNIKEELDDDGYIDNKVFVSQPIDTNDTELQDNITKHCEITTILDNIKTELSTSRSCNHNKNKDIKIEDEVVSAVDDIKIEFSNGSFFCEYCHMYYEDYCTKCRVLVHILNKNILANADNKTQELPNHLLEIKDSIEHQGVFALKIIPEGVKFGPFNGLSTTESCCRLKGGKLLLDKDKLKFLNWMQYIEPAKNVSEQNLHPFQCDNNLYFRSIHEIQPGEELFVYFGGEYEDSSNENVETDFIPIAEEVTEDVFACTFCCLGFSMSVYLAQHKRICPYKSKENFSSEELVQCSVCKIYLDKKEYLEFHRAYCCKRNVGRRTSLTSNEVVGVKKQKKRQTFKCVHCNYSTACRADFNIHVVKHPEVKKYGSDIVCNRSNTEESLRMQVEHVDIKVEAKGDQERSTNGCLKADVEAEDSKIHHDSQDETKQNILNKHMKIQHFKEFEYECMKCEYKTSHKSKLEVHIKSKHLKEFKFSSKLGKYKRNLKRHTKMRVNSQHLKKFKYTCEFCKYKTNAMSNLTVHIKIKHLKEFNYNCEICEYRTKIKSNLGRHIQTKHLKEYRYKCEICNFETNGMSRLNVHVKTKHLKEFKHECEMCEFKTNYKNSIMIHIKTKHVKEFNYNCEMCEYKTNIKSNFERHLKTNHVIEYRYKCEICNFKTNVKPHLHVHVKTKHLKEFNYTCEMCEFKTNCKKGLVLHVTTKHVKQFNYNCDICDYKTNIKSNLERHTKTRHLKEFRFECEICNFKTNEMSHLNVHVKSKHLGELKYKCEICEFKTNYKTSLERHVKGKHLKEFKYKCEICNFETNEMSHLNVHVKSKHLKKFKYKCEICKYKTNLKAGLDRHRKTKHREELSYECEISNIKTDDDSQLERHNT